MLLLLLPHKEFKNCAYGEDTGWDEITSGEGFVQDAEGEADSEQRRHQAKEDDTGEPPVFRGDKAVYGIVYQHGTRD